MVTKEQVYEALQECYDPEIPVNIVDLGLIYDVEINDDKIAVKMTLTAPGCGMGTMIAADAKQRIMALEGVGDATVDLVWDPPWNPSMIREEAKQRLGIGKQLACAIGVPRNDRDAERPGPEAEAGGCDLAGDPRL